MMELLYKLVFFLGIVVNIEFFGAVANSTPDPHGGVPMGIPNQFCDDGKTNISIDWDPESTEEYTCHEKLHEKLDTPKKFYHCDKEAKRPIHTCFPRHIVYTEDLPTSGEHRPIWPKYGEYLYVPPQRWLHNLEHGAVVFLYHPCADPDQIEAFKSVARGCLRRHIISPYKKMPPQMNFALLTWQCKLVMSEPDVSFMIQFIKARAFKSRESQVYQDGQYDAGLIRPAEILTNMQDKELCPKMPLMVETTDKIKSRSEARQAEGERSQKWLQSIVNRLMGGLEE